MGVTEHGRTHRLDLAASWMIGDTLDTDLTAGPHSIRAHNTLFWKTHHVVVRPGEHVKFEAINRAGWGTFGMLFVIGAMPVYLTFQRLDTSSYPAHSLD